MKYLLDTSVYSQPLRRAPLPQVIRKWEEVGDAACCISVFCEMEVLQGIKISGSEKLLDMYNSILKNRIPVFPFTGEEAEIYADIQARLIQTGIRRPVIDLCIAATSIAQGCTLVTLNTKDFSSIPGLLLDDWSDPSR
jgi:tRNA(fMet)-specific endonuclease VapC